MNQSLDNLRSSRFGCAVLIASLVVSAVSLTPSACYMEDSPSWWLPALAAGSLLIGLLAKSRAPILLFLQSLVPGLVIWAPALLIIIYAHINDGSSSAGLLVVLIALLFLPMHLLVCFLSLFVPLSGRMRPSLLGSFRAAITSQLFLQALIWWWLQGVGIPFPQFTM